MANYSCKKFVFATKSLATVHLLQTDGRTDIQTTTTMPITRSLLNYGQLKKTKRGVKSKKKAKQRTVKE